jgi:hypothetical protein
MNQNERNLSGFINLLQTSLSDVSSFRKNDVSSYFLMLRKFFENYVKENNEKYEFENPLYIKNEDAEKVTYFFSVMMEMFGNSKSENYIHEMTVLDKSTIEKIGEYQLEQFDDAQTNLRRQIETVTVHNQRMEYLLHELGIRR